MTDEHKQALRELAAHYGEQDCPRSRIHALEVLAGEADPEDFLTDDLEWWTQS